MKQFTKHALVLGLLLATSSYAELVCSVHDGDSIRVAKTSCKPAKSTKPIRLWGIDAPELGQPLAKESRNYLKAITQGKQVQIVECVGKSYQRKVCRVQLPTSRGPRQGDDVGVLMVRAGFAYDYPQFSKMAYHRPQAEAQNARAGVWGLPNGGIRPWQYRKMKRHKK